MARILVIENDAALRDLVEKFLRDAGHDVFTAEDGAVGITVFRHAPADLIITDIIMPNKEGIETIIELQREFEDVKIIAMSGGGDSNNLDVLGFARKLGAYQTLRKPFRRNEFLATVDEVLSSDIRIAE